MVRPHTTSSGAPDRAALEVPAAQGVGAAVEGLLAHGFRHRRRIDDLLLVERAEDRTDLRVVPGVRLDACSCRREDPLSALEVAGAVEADRLLTGTSCEEAGDGAVDV